MLSLSESWARICTSLGVAISEPAVRTAAAQLPHDPERGFAGLRDALTAAGASPAAVRRCLLGCVGALATSTAPDVLSQAAPIALVLGAGAGLDGAQPHLLSLLQTVRAEQRCWAERIHDGPLQDAIALQLRARAQSGQDGLAAELSTLIGGLRDIVRAASPDEDLGLRARLELEVQRCRWVDVDLRVEGDDAFDEPDELTCDVAVRVVAEALNNVRHATAHTAVVSVRIADSALDVVVRDDGLGFEVPADFVRRPGHLGLAYLAESISAVRGHLDVRSRPGAGTTVRATLPLLAEPALSRSA